MQDIFVFVHFKVRFFFTYINKIDLFICLFILGKYKTPAIFFLNLFLGPSVEVSKKGSEEREEYIFF